MARGKEDGEKRRYLRFDVETKVRFQIQPKGNEKVSTDQSFAIAKNLSIEGAYFVAATKLTPGTLLKLEVFLPAYERPLHLDCEVVWSKPVEIVKGKEVYEIGVRIFALKKSDEGKFIEYACDKMMERFSPYLHL